MTQHLPLGQRVQESRFAQIAIALRGIGNRAAAESGPKVNGICQLRLSAERRDGLVFRRKAANRGEHLTNKLCSRQRLFAGVESLERVVYGELMSDRPLMDLLRTYQVAH
jgi:hypothetical protein